MKRVVALLISLHIIVYSSEREQDPYKGYWFMPNNKVIIEIQEKNGEYIGFVRWLKDRVYPLGDRMEGKEQIDRNNPDVRLRDRKVMNLQVVGGLYKDEKNDLTGGWIYDSWNGKLYYGSAKLIDSNTVKLRGSLDKWGILGYSMEIKRVENKERKNMNFF